MSVSLWSYRPEYCDRDFCVGDCDLCDKPKNMEEEAVIKNKKKLGVFGLAEKEVPRCIILDKLMRELARHLNIDVYQVEKNAKVDVREYVGGLIRYEVYYELKG